MKRIIVTGWLTASFVLGAWAATVWGQEVIAEPAKIGTASLFIKQDGLEVPTMDFQMVVADESGAVNVIGGPAAMPFSFGFGDAMASPIPGFGGDMMSMLNNNSVQRDLELSDDQREQLRRLRQDFAQKVSEHARTLREGNFNPESGRNLGETIKQLQKQQAADLEEILLPHQMRRLREISVQTRLRSMGPTGALSDKEFAEELGITPEQLKKLKERAKEIGKELKEKMERLREEAQKELFKELTRDQLDKLQRMMGDRFEFPKDDEEAPRALRFKRSGGDE